jgi:hypothetical protein
MVSRSISRSQMGQSGRYSGSRGQPGEDFLPAPEGLLQLAVYEKVIDSFPQRAQAKGIIDLVANGGAGDAVA